MTHTTASALINQNLGKRWTKGNHDRVYLNVDALANAIRLETDRYNSGNISSATLDGERISNTHAREILESLSGARAYCDARTGRLHWYAAGRESELARTAIETLIANL